jgi:hypothetical protein
LDSIRLFLMDYKKIFLVLDDEVEVEKFLQNTILPDRTIVRIVPQKADTTGYIYQQYFKLNGDQFSSANYLLPIDSDTVFFRSATVQDWFVEGSPFIAYGNWRDCNSFPPNKLISQVIQGIGWRTHDINLYMNELRDKKDVYGVSIDSDNGSVLRFKYEGVPYILESSNLHATWLSAIQHLTQFPIDSMRAHYIFSREASQYIRDYIVKLFNTDFLSAISNVNAFPVFSEYQVFGNLINGVPNRFGYKFFDDTQSSIILDKLPIIKCNSRADSAMEVYQRIIKGAFANENSRNEVLHKIRLERKLFSAEDWG